MINVYFTRELAKAGYEFKIDGPTLYDGVEIGAIIVMDPVQCSSGAKRWTETREERMTHNGQVFRFLSERS